MRMKNTIKDLTLFGGRPTFEEVLHVGKPAVVNRNMLFERIDGILDRGWLTNNGPEVQAFEKKISEITGVKNCIAVCNATVGLEIAIRALGMRGEVILPSFTFVATAHSLQWQEITPVFCDIDPKTHTIDPKKILSLITPKTSGILATHVWGRPCQIDALTKIAKEHNLKLLFDAAHAFSNTFNGVPIGNFGDAEVFSFHATKFINTFEGGVIATNDDDLAERIRLMKNFGFKGLDNVIYLGTNGKMNEVSAAMGLVSLSSIDQLISHNKTNYKKYSDCLNGLPGISVASYNESDRNNYQYIVLEVEERLSGLSRDRLIDILHAENIRCRRYFYPGCHNMEPYRSYYPNANLLLRETEKLCSEVLLLPSGQAVDVEMIETISGIIKFCVENSEEINKSFKHQEI